MSETKNQQPTEQLDRRVQFALTQLEALVVTNSVGLAFATLSGDVVSSVETLGTLRSQLRELGATEANNLMLRLCRLMQAAFPDIEVDISSISEEHRGHGCVRDPELYGA